MLSSEQVESYRQLTLRVSEGKQLASSPKLRELLNYIVDCFLRDAPEDATEQQIGVHVFGRRPGYNSSEDSIVRSQMRLLRMKLAAFFSEEGANEPIQIEIPKGHYLPTFTFRENGIAHSLESESLQESPALSPTEEHPSERSTSWRRTSRLILSGLAVLCLGALLGYLWPRERASKLAEADALWAPFFDTKDPPLVIYANPIFRGTPQSGLLLQKDDSSNSPDLDDTYTGIGEAQAIHELTRFFDSHLRTFILKRSRLVTWDDAKTRSLIFLGAPTQNTALQDLPRYSEFVIALNENGKGYIQNLHPKNGEPQKFVVTQPTDEYAIVAMLPGLENQRRTLIFTGLTTIGTQAAVEYMCHPENSNLIIQRAGTNGKLVRPFEAVLRVRTSKGVALTTDLAAIHAR